MDDGAKFCPNCGAQAPVQQAAPAQQAATAVEAPVAAEPVAAAETPVVEAAPVVAEAAPVVAATATTPVTQAATAYAAEPAQPYVQQPYASQPYVEQPYIQAQPYMQQPYGNQPYGNQPYGNQPYGGQPMGGAQPYPNQAYAPQPAPAPMPQGAPMGAAPMPQGAPMGAAPMNAQKQQPKKKKKTWLVVLLAILGSLALIVVVAVVVIIILISIAAKKAGQKIEQFKSEFDVEALMQQYGTSEGFGFGDTDPSGYDLPNLYGMSDEDLELDHDVTIEDMSKRYYAGIINAVDVRGADEMIAYLESVSGKSLTEEEKNTLRSPAIFTNPVAELYIYKDEYSTGGWSMKFPVAYVQSTPEIHEISDWDLLSDAAVADGTHFDEVAISPVHNEFLVEGSVTDRIADYAGNFFKPYADVIGSKGTFGTRFEGKVRKNRVDQSKLGIDSKFQVSFQFDGMVEPYVVTYEIQFEELGEGEYK